MNVCNKFAFVELMSQGGNPELFFNSLITYAGLDPWAFSTIDMNDEKGFGEVLMKLADTCYQLKQENEALKNERTGQSSPLLLSSAAKASASASSSASAPPLPLKASDDIAAASLAATSAASASTAAQHKM